MQQQLLLLPHHAQHSLLVAGQWTPVHHCPLLVQLVSLQACLPVYLKAALPVAPRLPALAAVLAQPLPLLPATPRPEQRHPVAA